MLKFYFNGSPNPTRVITARPAAARAVALKDTFAFKPEMDDAARAVMFRHLAA